MHYLLLKRGCPQNTTSSSFRPLPITHPHDTRNKGQVSNHTCSSSNRSGRHEDNKQKAVKSNKNNTPPHIHFLTQTIVHCLCNVLCRHYTPCTTRTTYYISTVEHFSSLHPPEMPCSRKYSSPCAFSMHHLQFQRGIQYDTPFFVSSSFTSPRSRPRS